MKRFHLERSLMIKRWRQEWHNHGRDFGDCHCGRGIGTMRKHRPQEGHSSKNCRVCALARLLARQQRRKRRYAAKYYILDGG